MKTSDTVSVHDDLVFLRTLAEAGRNPRLVCGPYFLAAGLIYSITSFLTWGLSVIGTPLALRAILWAWIASTVAWIPVTWWLQRREANVAGVTATINRSIAIVWGGLSQAIGTIFLCCIIIAWRFETSLPWAVFPSVILALYGAGWTITSMISRQKWIRFIAIGSLAAAFLLAFVSGGSETFLVFGFILIVCVLIPGWWMVRGGQTSLRAVQ